MADNIQIEKWVREGIITQVQADKILMDTMASKKEDSSNKFIIAISTIGSILLGVGAILFVASNWDKIPNLTKTIILTGSTFAAYFTGYLFKYEKKNLPKVGSALLFLGGLLFGATLFLLAQIYHIEANSHTIVLIWLIGILPFVYAFTSSEMAGLAVIVFYVWIALFVLRDLGFGFFGFGRGFTDGWMDIFYLPVMYLSAGIAMFGIGGLHYFSDRLKRIARILRLSGIDVSLLALFLLSFRFFSGSYEGYSFRGEAVPSDTFSIMLTIFAIVAIITIIVNILYNPAKSAAPLIEYYVPLALTTIALIFLNFPSPPESNFYPILFSLALAGIIFLLLRQGYLRQDMTVVNIGLFFFVVFVLSKYFDFFWNLLDRSVFFIVGGIILLIGGIYLEGKRREVKAVIDHHK